MKQRIGRFRVIRPLGEGGMGKVFLAESTAAGGFARRVVLKQVRDAADPGLRRALLDEARVQATLVHRNIVPVLDLEEHEGEHFMVLEHVDGVDLRKLLALGPVPWPLVLHIGMEIAAGLDYVHRRTDGAGKPLGLVHRDVSPANILCSWEGEVKLTDFGIAKPSDVRSFGIAGNAAYMAPEQAAGDPVDGGADQFSLGVVMYEALTGKNPFRRKTDRATLDALRSGVIPPISDLLAPAELRSVILWAMAPDRGLRHENAAKLREALVAVPKRVPDPGPAFARYLAQARARLEADRPPLQRLVEAGRAFTRRVGLTGQVSLEEADATIAALPRHVLRRRIAALAVLLGATGGVLGVWWGTKERPTPTATPSASPTPSPSASPSPTPSPSPSASASASPSASPSPTPSPSASPSPTSPPTETTIDFKPVVVRKAPRPGFLSVNSIPWSNVWLDDKPLGHTPRMHVAVPAGKHKVRLRSQAGDERVRTVEINPGRESKLTVMFSAP
jgi:serine/threonine-protein kinase